VALYYQESSSIVKHYFFKTFLFLGNANKNKRVSSFSYPKLEILNLENELLESLSRYFSEIILIFAL